MTPRETTNTTTSRNGSRSAKSSTFAMISVQLPQVAET